jgi:hypothetical protein
VPGSTPSTPEPTGTQEPTPEPNRSRAVPFTADEYRALFYSWALLLLERVRETVRREKEVALSWAACRKFGLE